MLSDFHLARLVERFSRIGDTARLKTLASLDKRVVKCELCDKWFFKESTAFEDICPDCQESDFNDDSCSNTNQNFICKWCGIKFKRTRDWQSSKFCCEDCREKSVGLAEREEKRKERETNGII